MAFDSTITLGNIMILGGMFVSIVGSYYAIKGRVDRLDDKMDSKIELIDTKIQGLKEGTDARHGENQRSFDSVRRSIDDARLVSGNLAEKIAGLLPRISSLEVRSEKDSR